MRPSVISAWPSTIRQTSVVVPPMSKVSIRDVPSWRAMLTDAETPAAGPDIAITSGRRFTAEIGTMAPAE